MEFEPADDGETDTMMWIEVDLAGIMRAIPAGIEMNVRTIGSMREKNTVASPKRANHRSAVSMSCELMRT